MGFTDIISNLPWNKKMEVLRIAKGWTQEQAAEYCGTNKRVYWCWENGANYPRKNSKKAIAAAFKLPIGEIF